jgi:hypothetical protein
VRGYITHIDLQEGASTSRSRRVPVTLVGESIGVKEGGTTQATNTVNIEALPLEIPEHSY